jgi:hypothetical protein
MAALAKALQVGWVAVRWIVIQMSCGKYDASYPDSIEKLTERCQASPPLAIAPLAMV